MPRSIVAAAVSLLLAGCGHLVQPSVVSSTPRQVVIDAGIPPRPNIGPVQPLADAECAKHGAYAKVMSFPVQGVTREFVFECVK